MTEKNKILKIAYRSIMLIILAVLIILMFFRMTYVTRNKENAWMWDNFNALEENSVSALFVGNSHSFCSIDTDLLESVYGYSSFMLSASGQTMAMNYYAILEALKTQHPRVIYLETSYVIHEWKHSGLEMAHLFFDGMPLDSIKIEAVKDIIEKNDRICFYLPLGQYHSRWTGLTEEDYSSDLTAPLGSFHSDYVFNCWEIQTAPTIEKNPMAIVATEYLDKIIELCKAEGIELILYTVPYNSLYKDDDSALEASFYRQGVYHTLEDYAQEKEVTYYNLFNEVSDIGLDYSKDFMDAQHFNCYGQEKFTYYMVEHEYINVN